MFEKSVLDNTGRLADIIIVNCTNFNWDNPPVENLHYLPNLRSGDSCAQSYLPRCQNIAAINHHQHSDRGSESSTEVRTFLSKNKTRENLLQSKVLFQWRWKHANLEDPIKLDTKRQRQWC